MKRIKIFVLALFLTSTFFSTAFASTVEKKVPLSTKNRAFGVVYGEQETEVNSIQQVYYHQLYHKLKHFK